MKMLPHVRSFSELTTPAGALEPLYEDVETRGVDYRLGSLLSFARGVKSALERDHPFGIRIVHEPDNEHDPMAMKVVGWWRTSVLLRDKDHEEHLGYLPARMAYACHSMHKDKAIRARLVDITLDIDEPEVLIDVLHEV